MRKLLYLIPALLLMASFLPVSVYNDTVGFNPSAGLTQLTPSHWKIRELSFEASASLENVSSENPPKVKTLAISDGATFRGFPAGFYFVTNSSSQTSSGSSYSSISAYSWLWAAVDLCLVGLVLIGAIFLNRRPNAHNGYPDYHDQPMPNGYPPQQGYPQPQQYPPNQGYPQQPIYPQQSGYPPQQGYPQPQQYPPNQGYPPQEQYQQMPPPTQHQPRPHHQGHHHQSPSGEPQPYIPQQHNQNNSHHNHPPQPY